ncbi:carbohydrate ABC transporter permease [Mahella australiensis]|uniref:Binding-protein-dependent transport systems inner membrane component n=1 Tax=Mahella australiensis (strain DSM 15567 / CIP 107919 / 50-1 BON) TaxID=697281 RepID=F3ZZN7_MAHA5|nr:carbohydrate ABC transporter permease [Mahella australiensis]AEE96863.1 binding-protein-dependent transport systems inner membrane component [Mahella australiensis 50-1 BON]
MLVKRTAGERIFDIINAFILIILCIVCIYPMLYVVFASFSDPIELMKHRGLLLWPLGNPTIEGYKLVFQNPSITNGYKNTIIYVVAGTAINIFMTSLGAYVLSRKNVLWRNLMMFIVTFTMFFSGGMIPTYLLVKNLNMLNTRWAILIPGAISTYNMIIMRTSFAAIPDSLEESAKMDGANDFIVLFRIILPLSTAVLAVMVLFYGVGHWNAWFNAMIYLRDRNLFPLQLILREILLANDLQSMSDVGNLVGGAAMQAGTDVVYFARELVKYCTIVVATVPILALYPFLQKYFVKGVMIGSLKE